MKERTKATPPNPSSTTPPNLRITIGEDIFTPVRGTYNLSYSNGDGTSTGVNATSAAPPVLVNEQQVVEVTSDTEIKLNFEEAPKDYKVYNSEIIISTISSGRRLLMRDSVKKVD